MLRSSIYRDDVNDIVSSKYPWHHLNGKNIMITGATGMIGSIITDVLSTLLENGGDFTLTAVSRNQKELDRLFACHQDDRIRLVACDVNEPMDDLNCDTVIHCASNTHPAQYSGDPIGTICTNVIGLKNLLDMAVRSGKGRFVFASSVEIYGVGRGDVDSFDESYCGCIDCNTVRAGYNESKRVGESLCQAYGQKYGMDFVIPRISRTYGPSMRVGDTKAISQFISKAVSGEDIVLKSKGENIFSYCYSADAADAIIYLLFHGERGNAYNVAGLDSDVSLMVLAKKLSKIGGVGIKTEIPSEDELRGYSPAKNAILDITKIRDVGWSPRYDLDAGLRRTYDSMLNQDDYC